MILSQNMDLLFYLFSSWSLIAFTTFKSATFSHIVLGLSSQSENEYFNCCIC